MHFRDARQTWTPTDLHRANDAQRRQLLAAAPPQDLQDLLPILVENDRLARIAAKKAEDELAECLLQLQERGLLREKA